MAEIYTWTWPVRSVIMFLLVLCVLSQTLALVLSFYSRKRKLRALPELCVLAVILLCSLLYGQVLGSIDLRLIAPVNPTALRLALKGRIFIWICLIVILILLARSICISLLRYKEINTGISALSVKNAIDSLHTGILFSDPDGFILLSNAKMQRLMTEITGKIQRNGWHFYCTLTSGVLRPGCQKTEFEGQIVCLLPDGSAWMFTRTELPIGKKIYIQLTAADITERWELTAQLQRQGIQLEQSGEELKRTIANLHILSREREAQKAKMRAHDILGQRLSLLLRTVRNERDIRLEQALDHDLLRPLSLGLIDELLSGSEPSPQDALEELRQGFGSIGVNIRLEGKLPEDKAKGQMFVDILREGVTNAVRHGFATEVAIQMEHRDDGFRMRIANNGPPPPEIPIEGGGLSAMRKRLEPYGGTLQVDFDPHFVLTIYLPGGEDYV